MQVGGLEAEFLQAGHAHPEALARGLGRQGRQGSGQRGHRVRGQGPGRAARVLRGRDGADPAVLVGREHAVRCASGGQDLAALEHHVVLDRVHRDAQVCQASAHLGVARERVGIVIVAGVHRLHPQPGGHRGQLLGGPSVAADHAHRGGACHPVRLGQRPQFGIQHRQAVAQELHAPIGTRQRVQDRGVEDEGAPHAPRRLQGPVQGCMVFHAQVAAQPHQRTGEQAVGRRVVHAGKCRPE